MPDPHRAFSTGVEEAAGVDVSLVCARRALLTDAQRTTKKTRILFLWFFWVGLFFKPKITSADFQSPLLFSAKR